MIDLKNKLNLDKEKEDRLKRRKFKQIQGKYDFIKMILENHKEELDEYYKKVHPEDKTVSEDKLYGMIKNLAFFLQDSHIGDQHLSSNGEVDISDFLLVKLGYFRQRYGNKKEDYLDITEKGKKVKEKYFLIKSL